MNAGIYGLTSQEALGPYPLLGRPAPVPTVDPLVGFDPRAIPGIRLWLDASNSGSILTTTTGGTPCAPDEGVGRWEDQSGNGLHVLQGTANNRPVRKFRALNGMDGIQFDGSNDFLYAANQMFTNQLTVFFVSRATSSTARYWYFDFGNYAGSPVQSIGVEQNTFSTVGNRWGLYLPSRKPNGSVTQNTYDTTLATSTTPVIVSVSMSPIDFQPTVLQTDYRVNGVQSGAFSRRNGDLDTWRTISSFACMIGSINNGGTGISGVYLNGSIYEFIVYQSVIPVIQRRMVERYLGQKWGVTVA